MHVQDPAKNKQSKSNVSCTLIVTYDTELNLNTNPIFGSHVLDMANSVTKTGLAEHSKSNYLSIFTECTSLVVSNSG